MAFRVVHYINQFFANVGGEEMAHIAPELREGKGGPGAAFETAWKGEAVIVNTIVCGDSFFAEHEKEAKETVVNWVKEIKPDMFIAGPAFNAGRYGYACANIALEVKTQLGIPVLTGMYEENPGADLKDKILITPTANSAAGMRKAAPTMAALSLKLMKGEKLGASCEDGYMPNGIRVNFFEKERGAKRAVKMLLNKINGKPFTTEFPMPNFDRVEPGKAIPDMSKVVLGLATSGGIVSKCNPDRIESSNATRFGYYSIEGMDRLSKDDFFTVHGGYDRQFVLEDPNLAVPIDAMRNLEKAGEFGELVNYFATTTGTGTATGSAAKFGDAIGKRLLEENVQAVILTST